MGVKLSRGIENPSWPALCLADCLAKTIARHWIGVRFLPLSVGLKALQALPLMGWLA
jgi:hypothetical protein